MKVVHGLGGIPSHIGEGSLRERVLHAVLSLAAVSFLGFATTKSARAEATVNCPSGTYDMLDWMTLDSNLRGRYHLAGSANPLYTKMETGKFYWTKGGSGSPWDIQLSTFICGSRN